MADESVDDAKTRRPPAALVPLPLRNWHVLDQPSASPIEIDGEATVVEVTPSVSATTPVAEDTIATATPPALPALDQIDEAIIVSLSTRQQQIEAGATATYDITLLNNGPERALFTIRFADNRPTLWLAAPIPGLVLQPGERATVPVSLTPPRAAVSRAGEYRITFVVEADAYPQRQSEVTATLTIAPFVALKLGKVVVPYRTLTWWRRAVTVTAPLINSGNQPTAVILRAQDGAGVCHIAFQAPGLRQTRQQQALLTLQPGRMTPVALQVYAQSQSWFGRTKRICPIQLTLLAKAQPPIEQTALLKIAQAPVIGPWQVAALLGLCSMVVTGLGLGGLAVLAALIVNFAQPTTPVQDVSTAAPPAIVTILVQPAPASRQPVSLAQPAVMAAGPASNGSSPVANVGQPEARNPGVPLVQPEQISAPAGDGKPGTMEQTTATTQGVAAAVAAPPEPASTQQRMSYAQMFQEIALRYDLNWRMLAAQAYEESSFDSLALGSHGDLGLMQIRPSTWREWAPTVAASDPFDSYSNVLVAAAYLDYLRTTLSKQGHAEPEWMLVAYNWGPDKVLQHLANGGTWADLTPELQQYVEDVLRLAETIPPDAAF